MASLFDGLPSASGRPRVAADLDKEYKPASVLVENQYAAQVDGGEEEARPEKRARVEDDEPGAAAEAADRQGAPSSSGSLPADQVTAALRKIASHIGNPDKFTKASSLLRQLLDGAALTKQHREDLWNCVRAAFEDFDSASEASIRRDYMKLCYTLDKHLELLSKAQRAQFEVYRIVGFTQNELHTDDNFAFNKVIGRIKEHVGALPEASEEDEAAMEQLRDPEVAAAAAAAAHAAAQVRARAEAEALEEQRQRQAAAAQEPEEFDPFGLGSLLEAPAPKKPKPVADAAVVAAPSNTWTAAQTIVMRRQALIECLITARTLHKLPWARTSVELLVEHFNKHRDRFTGEQQLTVDEMVRFVKQARMGRAGGPSQKEINRDSTSFERAQKEWSRATVSHRGKVGAQGDAKANNWLG